MIGGTARRDGKRQPHQRYSFSLAPDNGNHEDQYGDLITAAASFGLCFFETLAYYR